LRPLGGKSDPPAPRCCIVLIKNIKHKYQLVNQSDLFSVLPEGGLYYRQGQDDQFDFLSRNRKAEAKGHDPLIQVHPKTIVFRSICAKQTSTGFARDSRELADCCQSYACKGLMALDSCLPRGAITDCLIRILLLNLSSTSSMLMYFALVNGSPAYDDAMAVTLTDIFFGHITRVSADSMQFD
jgi:hypothetical protein